ncbi:hypothetical protein QFC19_003455 [Naganishia cerealis]|uniref:Uncharacterized protein n=1 Tax=Naganishia cerealis TaxID=610337 RepID=A0ACC2W2S9_9TREE|nr:hypothetical protein QFC19_003455 [Naganishia cerealis]
MFRLRALLGLAPQVRQLMAPKWSHSVPTALMVHYNVPGVRNYSQKPFPVGSKEFQEQNNLKKLPKWKQWAIYFQSNEFKRGMTIYYVCGFGVMCVAFYYYMRDRYYEDKQLKHIRAKYEEDPASLLEYEYLKLKALSNDKLKPREQKKYRMYQMMRKEFRRKHIWDGEAMFEPTPQDLQEWYSQQARTKTSAAVTEDDVRSENSAEENSQETTRANDNSAICAPQDTTAFFEEKAFDYDNEVKWEERGILMGRRRRWLMKQLRGDVLEVACGTGRNIPYFDQDEVNSITFLDSLRNMVELAQKKFRQKYPRYANAAFTVGRAEDLVELQGSEQVKYDTIVEAFGLCAHEDPVLALKSMASLLKPGGRIVLLEHGRSTWDFINNHLDFRAPKRMKTWACRWNLDIGELIDDAGLDITYEKRVHLGTTWMLVCKRPEDPLALEEKPFLDKLFGRETKGIDKGKR